MSMRRYLGGICCCLLVFSSLPVVAIQTAGLDLPPRINLDIATDANSYLGSLGDSIRNNTNEGKTQNGRLVETDLPFLNIYSPKGALLYRSPKGALRGDGPSSNDAEIAEILRGMPESVAQRSPIAGTLSLQMMLDLLPESRKAAPAILGDGNYVVYVATTSVKGFKQKPAQADSIESLLASLRARDPKLRVDTLLVTATVKFAGF